MVPGMRDASDRYLRKRLGAEAGGGTTAVVEEVAAKVRTQEPGLRMLASRAYGLRAVVEPVWKRRGGGLRIARSSVR